MNYVTIYKKPNITVSQWDKTDSSLFEIKINQANVNSFAELDFVNEINNDNSLAESFGFQVLPYDIILTKEKIIRLMSKPCKSISSLIMSNYLFTLKTIIVTANSLLSIRNKLQSVSINMPSINTSNVFLTNNDEVKIIPVIEAEEQWAFEVGLGVLLYSMSTGIMSVQSLNNINLSLVKHLKLRKIIKLLLNKSSNTDIYIITNMINSINVGILNAQDLLISSIHYNNEAKLIRTESANGYFIIERNDVRKIVIQPLSEIIIFDFFMHIMIVAFTQCSIYYGFFSALLVALLLIYVFILSLKNGGIY